VKVKDFIIESDISNIDLADKSVDACIFCLALMGTNYIEFLIEASRILKVGGRLIITEVLSRITFKINFVNLILSLGFTLE
jgi:ubiquinone/menaquinone biosynthesis C-methylase UbiE